MIVPFQPNQPQQEDNKVGFGRRAMNLLQAIGGGLSNTFERNPNLLDTITLSLEGLAQRPNVPLMQMAQSNIAQRQQEQQVQEQANRTLDYFTGIGRSDIADIIRANPDMASQIYGSYVQRSLFPEPTEQYETFEGPDGQLYRRELTTNKVEAIGGGGSTLSPTFNVGGEEGSFGSAFREAIQAPIAATIAALPQQQEFLRDLEVLEGLINGADLSTAQRLIAQYGPNIGSLADETGRVGAAAAIIARLAPTIRETGSGSTSDREMAMYIRGLPSFLNDNANILTVELFRAKVKISEDIQEVATLMALNAISEAEGLRRINELRSKSIMTGDTIARIRRVMPDFQWEAYNSVPDEMGFNQQTVPSGYSGG